MKWYDEAIARRFEVKRKRKSMRNGSKFCAHLHFVNGNYYYGTAAVTCGCSLCGDTSGLYFEKINICNANESRMGTAS